MNRDVKFYVVRTILGIFIASIIFVLGNPTSISAAALTSETVIPWSSDVSVSTKHTINFTTTTTIPANGKVVITYPSGFDVSGAAFNAWSGFDGTRSVGVSGQVITITRLADGTGSTAGAKYIVLSGIVNHATAASAYTVSVETQDSGGTTLDGATTSTTFTITVTGDGLDTSAPWPIRGHDNRNSFNTSLTAPDYPTLAWRFVYADHDYHVGVVEDSNGVVYVGGTTNIYALNSDGTTKWSEAQSQSTSAGVALTSNSRLVIWYRNGKLESRNISDGSLVWSYTPSIGGTDAGSLNIGPDGSIYISTTAGIEGINSDGSRKFYNPATRNRDSIPSVDNVTGQMYTSSDGTLLGYNPDGTVKWSVGGVGSIGNPTQLTANGSVVCTEARNSVNNIGCFNTSNGATLWSVGTSSTGYGHGALSLDDSIYYTIYNAATLSARNIATGVAAWTQSFSGGFGYAGGGNAIVDGNNRIYAGQQAFNSDGSTRWKLTNTGTPNLAMGKSQTMVFNNRIGTIFNYKPWTVSLATNQTHYKAGDVVTLTATSSMLRTDPSSSEDNQVQVVMPNGDKVPLTYSSAVSGNTLWTGTYTIPTGTTDGAYTATVQAGAYNVVTDVTTTFASAPTGSTNTGITNSLSYTVDNTAPTGSVSIASGATFTTTPSVTLNLLATDASSGVNRMLISQSSDFTGATWETYAVTKALTLSSGDGTKTVYAKFEDVAGNVSAVSFDTIVLDTTAPTGSVSIASGATFTTTPTVTLNLLATDVSSGVNRMLISQSSDFTGASWETYAITKAITLSLGDGTKTVYVKFEDVAGNVSTTHSDTIILDSTSPVDEVSINAGATYTVSRDVTLTIAASDATAGLNRMLISEDATFIGAMWETYAITKAFTISSGDGTKTVYIKFEDVAGNVSTIFSDTIILDTIVPVGTIQIGGGVTHLKNHTANLSLSSTDATAGLNRMIIAESSSFTGALWETYTISKILTLSAGDGTKTVYVKYEDKAGRVSTVFSATVIVDTTTPTLVPTDLNTLNVDPTIFTYYYTTGKGLTISGTTEANATITITVNSDPVTCTTIADATGNFSCTFAATIPTGTHTVNITATDGAGNSITYPEMTLGIAVGLAATGSPALLSLLTLPLLGWLYFGTRKYLTV